MKTKVKKVSEGVIGYKSNKRSRVIIIFCLGILLMPKLSAQTASGTWALTSNANVVTVGNVSGTAASLGTGITSATYSSPSGISSTGWTDNSTSLVPNEYYEFKLTPTSNLNVTSINFEHSSSKGNWQVAAYYSTDNFVTSTLIGSVFTSNSTTPTAQNNTLNFNVQNTTLTIRIYGWLSGGPNRQLRIRNFVINGTTCSLPIISNQPTALTKCSGQSATFSVTASNVTAYQWRKNGTPISGATSNTFSIPSTSVSDAGNYDVVLTSTSQCNLISNSVTLAVNQAPVLTVAPATVSICSDGIQLLTASPAINNSIAVSIGSGTSVNSASGTNNSIFPAPYAANYENVKQQYLIRASELSSLGLVNGSVINSLTFDVTTLGTSGVHNGYTISMGNSNQSAIATWETGLTTVYGPINYQPISGANTHVFFNTFTWNGTSNLIIQICFSNDVTNSGNFKTVNAQSKYSTTAFNSSLIYRLDNAAACGSNSITYTEAQRPNMILSATIAPTVVWSPISDLYTNAGATNAYASSNLLAVFTKPTANRTFTATATASNGCVSTASSTVSYFSPSVGGSLSGATTVCYGNNSGTLTLSGNNGAVLGWETSLDNFATSGLEVANTSSIINYSNLLETTYYRAIVGNGVCSSVYSAVAVITVSTATTWTGTFGTSWSNAANWSCGLVPTTSLDVTIPFTTNQPVISSDAYAKSLTINATATLTINSTFDLTISNAINNSGTITVNNNANLIQVNTVANSGAGATIVNRDGPSLMRLDYILWSSPVLGQQLQAFSPLTLSNRFYTYNATTDLYAAVSTPSATNFDVGKGYLIRMPNNHPTTPTLWSGTFQGSPNNGTINLGVTNNTYNAIGNPYPSTINADLFISENNLTGALYFWRKKNNAANPSYATYTLAGGVGTGNSGDPLGLIPNETIQIGQGFITKSTSSTIVFTNSMRMGNNANQMLRTATNERSRIWITLSGDNDTFCQTMLAYMPGATSGFDPAIDGRFFNDSQTALTTLIADEEYSIQGRSLPFDTSDQVPMGFKSVFDGNFQIALDHFDGLFENNQEVFIKDNFDNSIHNLKLEPFIFSSLAGVFNSRFVILFQNSLGTNPLHFNSNSVIVYKKNQEIRVNSGNNPMSEIKVFDISGRLLETKNNINSFETTLKINTNNQLLLLQITSQKDEVIVKKIIN